MAQIIDPDSALALQAVPMYEGIEGFSQKIQDIRQNEGREPLCLVLCGGSARAFCHIGVLKAMEENNIVPDCIVANSMGAVIGMLYAYGFSPQKIEEVVSTINLSSYFEPVFPLRGGILSVRKFEALINQLLGEESHRIEDCAIPILLLTEDLYTKRQIWHAGGDFAKIMDAAFAMSVFMEPVEYTLNCGPDAGTKVKLIDSGAIDIAGLSVARHFSENLVVSTAFYDTDLNYNNPIVIINRTMSIGKERIAVKDLMTYEPVLIRNDVEHFSFMDFQKSREITKAGYDTAVSVMDQLLNCPHAKLDSSKDLNERRKITDRLAEEEIFRVQNDIAPEITEPYAGVKLWPTFGVVDYPDAYLYERDGISVDAFVELPKTMFKLKVQQPFTFDGLCTDLVFTSRIANFLRLSLLGSYLFDYSDFTQSSFYGFAGLNIRPSFLPVWFKSVVLTGEWKSSYKFETTEYLFTAGFKTLFGRENDTYLFVKPYFFITGTDFAQPEPGIGSDLQACWNMFKYFGIGEYAGLRYYFGDNLFTVSNCSELYFVQKSPNLTFAETLIVQQFKLGGYYEFDLTLPYDNSLLNYAGAFIRADVSVIGLTNFIMETKAGWDFNENKFYARFELKSRM